ncbi:MAG TPA: glycosyltransferase family 4 protein [Methylomirabilota bacterium]|nr:glycosyltransferase family 4 protein [Methylomirabilota bacterium]
MRVCSPHCGLDPETTSGGETYERELLIHLAGLGVVNELILARHKRVPAGVANLVVHRLPIARGLRWPVAALAFPPAIARVYRKTLFDLLRVHSLRYVGPAALLARWLYRLDVPIVSHHHHLDPSPLNPLIERRVLQASERIVTVSEFSKRQLASALGIPAERIEVVPNGVDEKFVPAPGGAALKARYGLGDGPVALFLGGLKPRKNLPFLLHVWRDVAAARPEATLVIAGDGPLGGAVRRQAEAMGLGLRVVFTGRLPEADKVAHYNLADIFLFPSALEGFGLAVGEAMSCGLPVIASDEGALPELVAHGQGGFVCRGGDRAAFVEATLRLLDQPELRRRLGAFNRERVDRHFRWPRAARRVLDIYVEVVGDWKRDVRRA